jgi:O-antigen ligase
VSGQPLAARPIPLDAPPGRLATALAAAGLPLLLALAVPPLAGETRFYLLASAIGVLATALALDRGIGAVPPAARLPLAGLALWAAATTAWAPDRLRAVSAGLWGVALCAVFAAATRFGARALVPALAAFLAVAVPPLGHGLLQYLGLLPHPDWASPTRLSGWFVNSNVYAAFAGAALLAGVTLVGDRFRPLALRALAAVAIPLALASLVATASRGGWLAAAAGLAVLAARGLRESGRRVRFAAALAIGGVLSGSALVAWRASGGLDRVATRLSDAGSYSAWHRLAIYRGALELLRARPLGVGLGGFEPAFSRYRVHSDRFTVNFAHSDLLEAILVLGVPGVVLLAVTSARYLALPRSGPPAGAAAGACAILAAFGVQSVYDFPLRRPVLALLAAALAGALVPAAPAARRSIAGLGLVVLGLGLVLLHGERIRLAAESDEARRAFLRAEEGYVRADRWLLRGSSELARAAGAMNASLARLPRLGSIFLGRAERWYALALERNPGDGAAALGAAVVAEARDDPTAARTRYLQAAAADPTSAETLLGAAGFFARHGDGARAFALAAQALDTLPAAAQPARVIDTAVRAELPAETIAVALPVRSPRLGALCTALRAAGREDAALLLLARREPRPGPAP